MIARSTAMTRHAVEPRQRLSASTTSSARGAELARLDRQRWEQDAAREVQKKEASAALLASRKAYAPACPLPGSPQRKAFSPGTDASPHRSPDARTQQRPYPIARSNTAPIRSTSSPVHPSSPGGFASTSRSPPTIFYCASPLNGLSPPAGQAVRYPRSTGALRGRPPRGACGPSGSEAPAQGRHAPAAPPGASAWGQPAAAAGWRHMHAETASTPETVDGSTEDRRTNSALNWTFGWRGAAQPARLASTPTAAGATGPSNCSPVTPAPASDAALSARSADSPTNSLGCHAGSADLDFDTFTTDEMAELQLPGPALASRRCPVRRLDLALLEASPCMNAGEGREASEAWEAGRLSVPSPARCASEILADSHCDFEAEEAEALKAAVHTDRAALAAELSWHHNGPVAPIGGGVSTATRACAGVSSSVTCADGSLDGSLVSVLAGAEVPAASAAVPPLRTWARCTGLVSPRVEGERAGARPTKLYPTAVPLASYVAETASAGACPLLRASATASAPDLSPAQASSASACEWTDAQAEEAPPQASTGVAPSEPCAHAQLVEAVCSPNGGAAWHGCLTAHSSTRDAQGEHALSGFFGRLGPGPALRAHPLRRTSAQAPAELIACKVDESESATCEGHAVGVGVVPGAKVALHAQHVEALMDQVEALAACLREEQAARFQAEKRLRDEELHSAALTDQVARLIEQVEETRRLRDGADTRIGEPESMVRLPSTDAAPSIRDP